MPLFRNSNGGATAFKPPLASQTSSRRGRHSDGDASSPRSAPLTHIKGLSDLGSGGPHFIHSSSSSAVAGVPRASAATTTTEGGVPQPQPLGVKRRREVVYPESGGSHGGGGGGVNELLAARMARRTNVEYHQPDPASLPAAAKKKKPDPDDLIDPDVVKMMLAKQAKEEAAAKAQEEEEMRQRAASLAGPAGSPVSGAPAAGAAGTGAAAEGEEEEEDKPEVVSRYPVSPYGKLYFQIETDDAATRFESVGIIVIDTEELGVMMFDRVGRQFGNRPEPGYPIKAEDVENAKAGTTLKVGGKTVLLVTALCEEAFRSGEFFLRSEHDLRIKEDKAKAKAEAEAASTRVVKPKMSFGNALCGNLFAALSFRKRPKEGTTGFIVPVAGRPKMGRNGLLEELKPLHDHDREGAVVLFRADYKRDAHGRRQVSVVVDPVIGDKLRPHQRAGVKFLFDCITGERMPGYHGAILADEMGLGKTIQTVATIYTCLKQGKHGVPTAHKCLVVTPSSLVKNWCNEFDKWLGEGAVKHFAISESTPKGDRIISRFDGEGDVLVISYDQLRKYITRIAGLRSIQLVVCDEGHRLKNAEVKTTKAVDMLPTRNRIILSGTPIQNDLSEFHAMVGFVNPGILGNRDLFTRVFEEPVSLGRDPDTPESLKLLGHDRAHYLSTLTQRFILRRTQSINESYLPPKVDVTVYVRLGQQQQEAYQRLSDILESAACTPLVLISALRKLCNHMDLFHEAVQLSQQSAKGAEKGEAAGGRGRRARKVGEGIPLSVLPKGFRRGRLDQDSGSKLHFVSLMLDELRSSGDHDKLVIVSNFTQTLDIIAALCQQKRVAYFQLDGSTPIKKRQELVDYFNVPGSQEIVFLLSSKAGGVGLNLIGANRLILFDPDWNPANDAQAMGRVWRDGQKKRVFIYRLLSTGTIEEKIYQRQVSKQGLSANVVDMEEDSKQHFTLEELKSLFRYKSDTLSETHDLLGCTTCEAAQDLAKKSGKAGKDEPVKMQFRRVTSEQKKKSGPRMDELKAWRHVSSIAGFSLDKVTRAIAAQAPSLVSFLFADERDNTVKPIPSGGAGRKGAGAAEPQVRVEKPRFTEDEESIIVPSQAAIEEEESAMEIEVHSDDSSAEEEEEEEDEEFVSSSSSSE